MLKHMFKLKPMHIVPCLIGLVGTMTAPQAIADDGSCRLDQTGIDTSAYTHTTSNIYGGPGVLRTWSAKTLGAGKINTGFSASGSPWGNRLVNNQLIHYPGTANNTPDTTKVTEILDGAVRPFIAIGIGNYFDFGAALPIYINKITANDYDNINTSHPYLHDILNQDPTWGAKGTGDIEIWGKLQYPPYKHSKTFDMALFGKITSPTTASKNKGFVPGESFYIPKDSTKAINAFSATKPTGTVMMLWTLDLDQLIFNLNYGLQTNLNSNLDNSFLLNGALQWLPHPSFEMFLEFSGQSRLRNFDGGRYLTDDPMFVTPGFKVKTDNGWALTFGLDHGLSTKSPDRIQKLRVVDPKNSNNYTEYQVLPTRDWGMSGAITWSGYVINLDTDGDGVADNEDMCPRTDANVKVDAKGCELDTDDDCVIDRDDKCAETPKGVQVYREGMAIGCPIDSDLDKVPDYVDQCPNTPAGVGVDKNGCPLDQDKDGIVDYEDKCPNTPAGATVDTLGCTLDSDHDGVGDYLDQCPNTPANVVVNKDGCAPDADKDSVPDYQDLCKNTPLGAKVDSTGCELDEDNDRVIDRLDQCPQTPAGWSVDKVGCPLDADKDGVSDYLDKCPNTPAGSKVDSLGCPDTDKDGVSDIIDKCPATPFGAKVDTTGCPTDTDGDGVFDYLDKCPETPKGTLVDNDGCPVPVKLKAKIVLRGINFEVGKATLTPDSYEKLNEVAITLKENTDAVIEIGGHTDNAGVAKKNDKLSLERAQSVVEYLVGQGLPRTMLVAKGYGSKKPVASNKTAAGKAQNRRIEMMRIK